MQLGKIFAVACIGAQASTLFGQFTLDPSRTQDLYQGLTNSVLGREVQSARLHANAWNEMLTLVFHYDDGQPVSIERWFGESNGNCGWQLWDFKSSIDPNRRLVGIELLAA